MVTYAQAGILIPLILTTILAVAVGGGEGILATKLGVPPGGPGAAPAPATVQPAEASAKEKAGAEHGSEKDKPVTGTIVRELSPIVTNIAMPEDVWVRLEASVVYDTAKLPNADMTMREITSDILAYLRTLSLPQIQGARGRRHLREDLSERVAIRTEGKVNELLIQGMVVQ